jgi:hypothetical protein
MTISALSLLEEGTRLLEPVQIGKEAGQEKDDETSQATLERTVD